MYRLLTNNSIVSYEVDEETCFLIEAAMHSGEKTIKILEPCANSEWVLLNVSNIVGIIKQKDTNENISEALSEVQELDVLRFSEVFEVIGKDEV